MAKLNDAELASLDAIIAAKKANITPAGFINIQNIVNDAVNLAEGVVVTAAAIAVTAEVIGGGGVTATDVYEKHPELKPSGDGPSLDDLMAIRASAISDD